MSLSKPNMVYFSQATETNAASSLFPRKDYKAWHIRTSSMTRSSLEQDITVLWPQAIYAAQERRAWAYSCETPLEGPVRLRRAFRALLWHPVRIDGRVFAQ